MSVTPYIPWPRWLQQRAHEYFVKATGGAWPGQAKEADALLDKIREVELAPREPRKPWSRATSRVTPHATGVDTTALAFPKVAPGRSQAERRAERNEGMSAGRRNAFARNDRLWGGRCAWCFVGEAVHAHHVLGGADRRAEESEFSLAPICGGPDDRDSCHGRTELSPAWDLEQSLAWARRLAAEPRLTAAERAGYAAVVDQLERSQALLDAKHLTCGGGTP